MQRIITKPSRPNSRQRINPRQAARTRKPIYLAIIGAGRLGTALGLALKASGYKIEIVAAARSTSARKAAKLFGPGTLALAANQLAGLSGEKLARFHRCAVVLIATPDDRIESTALQLAGISKPQSASQALLPRRRVALHTSGALTSNVLKPMREAGFAVGSLHPLVSISDSLAGARQLSGAFFSIEGDPTATRAAKSLVTAVGGKSFLIPVERKALYHAAALMASPNLTALFDIAVEMLGVCGLKPSSARRILLPLVQSTLANLEDQDAGQALTGTFKRGDKATVKKHLAALGEAQVAQALGIYVLLGQRSISMAREFGADPNDLDEIERLLSGESQK